LLLSLGTNGTSAGCRPCRRIQTQRALLLTLCEYAGRTPRKRIAAGQKVAGSFGVSLPAAAIQAIVAAKTFVTETGTALLAMISARRVVITAGGKFRPAFSTRLFLWLCFHCGRFPDPPQAAQRTFTPPAVSNPVAWHNGQGKAGAGL
jgi:hypothetical protein